MATLVGEARPGIPSARARRAIRPHTLVATAGAAAAVALVLLLARRGPEGRILADRPVHGYPPLWGYHHWLATVQVATLLASGVFLAHFVLWSRRRARLHPALPVLGGLFVMGGLTDAFANWTSSAAMNPGLLHYPTSWAFFDVSPTVEPIINTVAYPYLFLFPALAVTTVLNRRGTAASSWEIFALTFAVAVPINWVLVNLFMCRIGYWTYTQIPGWAVVRGGTPWQYPWTDPPTLAVLTGVTAVLLQRPPGAGAVRRTAAAVLITALAYVPYNAVWASFRLTDSGDTLAPWPFADTKVYDPHGAYADAGVPGPYFRGVWP